MTMTKFEKHDVLSAGMEIPGAAGGLREPLKLDPTELRLDAECFVVMRLSVDKVRFDPIKDTDGGLTRVHVMKVLEAAFVDADVVQEQLAETRRRIVEHKRLEDEAAGRPQLPLDDGGPERIVEADFGATAENSRKMTAEERLDADAARPFPPRDRAPEPSSVG